MISSKYNFFIEIINKTIEWQHWVTLVLEEETMNKKDIIDYVIESPQNSNPAVLSTMLDSFEKGDNKEEIELSATENKVYTPETGKVYKKVTVNVPAPPSDYSSAQVVINNEEALYTWELWLPIIESNQITMEECSNSGTYVVPLYKGTMVTEERGGAPAPTITGNCTYDNGTLTITGDCTINFGGSSEE